MHNFPRIARLPHAWCNIAAAATIICLGTLSLSAHAADADQVRQMQQVIDEQRRQLEAQQKQLEAQQKQLNAQREVLEQVQIQLGDMSNEDEDEDKNKEVAATVIQTDEPISATPIAQTEPKAKKSGVEWGQDSTSQSSFNMNYQWTKLDAFPTDIAGNRGVFITSDDGDKMLRLYGGIRTRAVWDDRDVSQPWSLDFTEIPTGSADRSENNLRFDIRESRFGADVNVRDALSLRAEFDWKGIGDDELRIRQMYLRTRHWVVGKNWPVMNNINFQPLALDYHGVGGVIGERTNQIRYMNGFEKWSYRISLEDRKQKIVAPDAIEASAKRDFPNLAASLSHNADWGEVRVSGMLVPNEVRYDGGSQSDLGWGLLFGTRLVVNDSNVLKVYAHRINGLGSINAEFNDYDMVYNPNTGSFDNRTTTGAGLAIEHNWTPVLSTSLSGGYINIDLKSFQDDLSLNEGYGSSVNLMWRPKGRLDGVMIGAEFEHAERTNNDNSSNNANRVSLATWYDF